MRKINRKSELKQELYARLHCSRLECLCRFAECRQRHIGVWQKKVYVVQCIEGVKLQDQVFCFRESELSGHRNVECRVARAPVSIATEISVRSRCRCGNVPMPERVRLRKSLRLNVAP